MSTDVPSEEVLDTSFTSNAAVAEEPVISSSSTPDVSSKPMTAAERRRANILARSGAGRNLMDIKAPTTPSTSPEQTANSTQTPTSDADTVNTTSNDVEDIKTISPTPASAPAPAPIPMTPQERAAARRARILALGDRRMALVNGEIKTREAKEELTAPVDVSEFVSSIPSTPPSAPLVTANAKPSSSSTTVAPTVTVKTGSQAQPDLKKRMIDVRQTPYAIQQRYKWWENVLRVVFLLFAAILFCLPIPYSTDSFDSSSIGIARSILHSTFYILDSPFLSFTWVVVLIELFLFSFFYLLRATNPILRKEDAREEELMIQHQEKQARQQREARAALIPKSGSGNAFGAPSEMEASLEKMFSQVDKISGLVDGVGPGAGKALWYLGKAMSIQAFVRRTFDGFCFALCAVVVLLTLKQTVEKYVL